MTCVLGLDLSLTSTGVVVVPELWSLRWADIIATTIRVPLAPHAGEHERLDRIDSIARAVVAQAENGGATIAVVEQYAFTSRHAHAHALGELGGLVKVMLRRIGLGVEVVSPARARKILLGSAPLRDGKIITRRALESLAFPASWSDDIADAFVVANAWLSENGGDAFVAPERRPT